MRALSESRSEAARPMVYIKPEPGPIMQIGDRVVCLLQARRGEIVRQKLKTEV